VADEIEYQQFEQGASPASPDGEVDLRRIGPIPMELSVEIGRTQMTVGEMLALRAGSVVTLDRFAGEPVDLLVNGTPIARGEVVVVDDKFGLRVSQVLSDGEVGRQTPSDQASGPEGAEQPAITEITEAGGTPAAVEA
jgi:flagellar motor switch protein FliN/FliY